MSFILMVHLVVHILACSVNPADDAVLDKLARGDRHLAPFDRTVHPHVIENLHCNICDVNVYCVHCVLYSLHSSLPAASAVVVLMP